MRAEVRTEERAEAPVVRQEVVAHKVSGRNIPNFSFTGEMRVSRQSEGDNSAAGESSRQALSEESMAKVRDCWPELQKHLESSGKIRLLAALAHSRFDGGIIAVKVANKAIEQEVLDARAEIQEFIFECVNLKVSIVVELTADEVFVNKPVSDSQRLQAIIEKHPEIKQFCDQLKLRL